MALSNLVIALIRHLLLMLCVIGLEWSCVPEGLLDFGFALVDFSIFLDKFNDIGSQLNRLSKSFNAAVGSAQSRFLPQGRRFAELAGQNGEIDLSDQIDEMVRQIQGDS